jgi:hypothetical protein
MQAAVVDEVPKLLPCEQRVLGQTLSANVALIRNMWRAWWRQKPQRVWAWVLGDWDAPTASHLVDQLRDMIDDSINLRGCPEHWAALPEDVACHRDVEAFVVPQEDPRVGLRGQRGLRVKATAQAVAAGTLLGPYRAHVLTRDEYMIFRDGELGEVGGLQYKHGSDPRFAESLKAVEPHVRELLFESFGADYNHKHAFEKTRTKAAPELNIGSQSIKLPRDYELIASAYGFGNLMALVNDVKGPAGGEEEEEEEEEEIEEDEAPIAPVAARGSGRGRGRPPGRGRGRGLGRGRGASFTEDGAAPPARKGRPTAALSGPKQNVRWVEIAVHGWPFLFMCTCRDVQPGQELLITYGRGYWARLAELQGWTSGAQADGAAGGEEQPVEHYQYSSDDEQGDGDGDGGGDGGEGQAAAEGPPEAPAATSPARAQSHVTVSGLTVFMDDMDDA